jgi:hypothetical protein
VVDPGEVLDGRIVGQLCAWSRHQARKSVRWCP